MSGLASKSLSGLASLLLCATSLPIRAEPPSGAGRPDLSLPGDPLGGEVVSPYGTDVPSECAGFITAGGGEWFVVWDRTLESPRLAFPWSPRPLFRKSGEALGEGGTLPDVAGAVGAFLDEHREFFGVDSTRLSPLVAAPFDDGHLVTAYQVHGGIAVRGSAVRVRLNGDGTLRSLSLKVARRLPELPAARVAVAELLPRVAEVGSTPDSGPPPAAAVVFPGGLDTATPAWSAVAIDGREEWELIYSALTGERLHQGSLVVHFDQTVTGSATGFSPHPEDIFSLPRAEEPEPFPLAGAFAEGRVRGEALDVAIANREGRFALEFKDLPAGVTAYDFKLNLGTPFFFVLTQGLPQFHTQERLGVPFTSEVLLRLNEERDEFKSFHLMVFQQLQKARAITGLVVTEQGLSFDRLTTAGVSLANDGFRNTFGIQTQHIHLASDQSPGMEVDGATGRWRKIVPTIIYHEFGHMACVRLAGGARDIPMGDGIADALACYIARVSTLGFARDAFDAREQPTAHEQARDLKNDRTAFRNQDEARTAVAGALWELWESTLDPPEAEGRRPQSRFAFGLLVRWLTSKRVTGVEPRDALPFEYSPVLGVEFFIEADHDRFEGDGNLANGIPRQSELVAAFGRRNLFPHAFLRGDATGDHDRNIADAIRILNALFVEGLANNTCPDALDVDDSGRIDLSDAVGLLMFLFQGGRQPRAPALDCGWDVTSDDGLGCFDSPCKYFPRGREPEPKG